jgi:site-specific recombinase XerD
MTNNIHELFQKYVDELQFTLGRSPETARACRDSFSRFTSLVPEVSLVEELSPEVMTTFLKRLQTRERVVGRERKVTGVKQSTASSYAGRLKTFTKWMFMRGYAGQDPFASISLEVREFTEQQAMSREQVQKIVGAACQYASNPFLLRRDMAMISLFLFCGLRKNELLSIETRDVDLVKSLITVRAQTSKSKRTRVLPINFELKRQLREYFDERKRKGCTTPYFFASDRDRRFTAGGLKHWVDRLVRRSGIKFHVHQFRHTFAVNLAMQDVGAVKIQNLLGHRQLSMTQSYLRSIDTRDLRGDVEKLRFEDLK